MTDYLLPMGIICKVYIHVGMWHAVDICYNGTNTLQNELCIYTCIYILRLTNMCILTTSVRN